MNQLPTATALIEITKQVPISGIRSLSHVSAYLQSASLMDPMELGGLDSSIAYLLRVCLAVRQWVQLGIQISCEPSES
jgi:hypothetical protein